MDLLPKKRNVYHLHAKIRIIHLNLPLNGLPHNVIFMKVHRAKIMFQKSKLLFLFQIEFGKKYFFKTLMRFFFPKSKLVTMASET